MIGRKNKEVLVPKHQQASQKRRWQEEIDTKESSDEEVTAEEMEQWRLREEERIKAEEAAKARAAEEAKRQRRSMKEKSRAASDDEDDRERSPSRGKKEAKGDKRKRYAWMDSDEENAEEPPAPPPLDVPPPPPPDEPAPPPPAGPPSPPHRTENHARPPPPPPLDQFRAAEMAAPMALGLPGGAAAPQMASMAMMGQVPLGMMGGMGGMPGQIFPRPAVPRVSASGLEDEKLVGRIKWYVDMAGGGGYGFIDCEDTKLRFSRDVYVHKNQMQGLVIGDQVVFQITRNAKGDPQARNVMKMEDAIRTGQFPLGGPPAASGALSSQADSLMTEEQARQFQAALRK